MEAEITHIQGFDKETNTEPCIIISWQDEKGFFGEHTIYFKSKENKWYIDTETLGKEHLKKVLEALIDSMEIK